MVFVVEYMYPRYRENDAFGSSSIFDLLREISSSVNHKSNLCTLHGHYRYIFQSCRSLYPQNRVRQLLPGNCSWTTVTFATSVGSAVTFEPVPATLLLGEAQ